MLDLFRGNPESRFRSSVLHCPKADSTGATRHSDIATSLIIDPPDLTGGTRLAGETYRHKRNGRPAMPNGLLSCDVIWLTVAPKHDEAGLDSAQRENSFIR
jgi:hypothetical protein